MGVNTQFVLTNNVTQTFNATYYRAYADISTNMRLFSSPEIGVYITGEKNIRAKLGFSASKILNEEGHNFQPIANIYFRKKLPKKPVNFNYGICFDTQKTIFTYEGKEASDIHLGKGLFIGVYSKRIALDLSIKHYKFEHNYRRPCTYCYFRTASPRSSVNLSLNYRFFRN